VTHRHQITIASCGANHPPALASTGQGDPGRSFQPSPPLLDLASTHYAEGPRHCCCFTERGAKLSRSYLGRFAWLIRKDHCHRQAASREPPASQTKANLIFRADNIQTLSRIQCLIKLVIGIPVGALPASPTKPGAASLGALLSQMPGPDQPHAPDRALSSVLGQARTLNANIRTVA